MIDFSFTRYKYPEVEFWFDGKFQFLLENPAELMRIQLVAFDHGCTEKIHFMFQGEKLTLTEKGELSKWPKGMYDQEQRLIGALIKSRNGTPTFSLYTTITEGDKLTPIF